MYTSHVKLTSHVWMLAKTSNTRVPDSGELRKSYMSV